MASPCLSQNVLKLGTAPQEFRLTQTKQRELLQKKLQQLLLLFLRKLQLFLCQFGEPSLPHAVSALFTVVETGAPPFILYKNIVNLNKSVNQNAVD